MGEGRARIEKFRPRHFPRYPNYKDSDVDWLGEIPAHWERYRLRWTVNGCQNGVWGDEADGMNDTICVRVADFNRTQFLVNLHDPTLRSIDPRIADTRLLKKKDLLLEKSGGGEKQPVGAVVMYNHRLPAVCSNFVARMPVAEGHHPRYLTYLHAALYTARINTRSIKQSTGIQNLDGASYLSEYVGTPGDREQCEIATFLDRETAKIDALVAKKERLRELLHEKRTALIARVVTQGIHPPIDTRATASHVFPVVPKNWTLWKMRRLIRQVKRPIAVQPDQEYREIGIRSWGKGIFHKDPVRGRLLGQKNLFLLEPGDFVLNIIFAWEGAVAVVSRREAGMIASHRFPTFRASGHVDLDYLLMVLQSDQGRRLMEINSPGAAGRNKTLRIGQLLDEEIPLPNRQTQQAIVAAFRKTEGQLAALAAKIRHAIDYLKEYRTALISAAITGKIDVRKEVG